MPEQGQAKKNQQSQDKQATEEVKKAAEQQLGRQPTAEELQAFAQAYALWYRKTDGMTDEESEEYRKLLESTNPNVAVEERFKMADRLFKIWKDEQQASSEDNENNESESSADDGSGEDDEGDSFGDNRMKTKEQGQTYATAPGVEVDTGSKQTRAGDNKAPKYDEAPLGTDEKFYQALLNFHRGSQRKRKSNPNYTRNPG